MCNVRPRSVLNTLTHKRPSPRARASREPTFTSKQGGEGNVKISTPGQDTREDGHATADTPGTGHSGHTDSGHAHLRKPAQTETHTQPTATPNRNPPLTPARRLTPVALSRGHDALLRELHRSRMKSRAQSGQASGSHNAEKPTSSAPARQTASRRNSS